MSKALWIVAVAAIAFGLLSLPSVGVFVLPLGIVIMGAALHLSGYARWGLATVIAGGCLLGAIVVLIAAAN